MPQIEIKIVLFNPAGLGYVADVYVNGERVHCGAKSHEQAITAARTACEEMRLNAEFAFAVNRAELS